MSENTFDAEAFMISVLGWVRALKNMPATMGKRDERFDKLKTLTKDRFKLFNLPFIDWLLFKISFLSSSITIYRYNRLYRKEYENINALLSERKLKDELCPMLKTCCTTNNAKKIATVITPKLMALINNKELSIQVDPRFFALIALNISRRGIKNYCQGYSKQLNSETEFLM